MIQSANDLRAFILKTVQPVIRRVHDMVRLGKVSSIKDDDDVQVMQALDMRGRPEDDIVNLNPYGLSANPPPGSKGVMLSLQGNTDESVMLCASPSKRPAVDVGEVIVWSTHEQQLKLLKDGTVVLNCKLNGAVLTMKPDGTATLVSIGGAAIGLAPGGTITVTPGGAGTIKLGGDLASLGVARQTDAVAPSPQEIAYKTYCEGLFNSLLPGSFTPLNSYAATVAQVGLISAGSAKVKAT